MSVTVKCPWYNKVAMNLSDEFKIWFYDDTPKIIISWNRIQTLLDHHDASYDVMPFYYIYLPPIKIIWRANHAKHIAIYFIKRTITIHNLVWTILDKILSIQFIYNLYVE